MPVGEVKVTYAPRPKGSRTKLSTWRDGFRIFAAIIFLCKEVRPARFFGAIFAVLALMSLVLSYPLIVTYFQTGLVPRLPTVVLATVIMVLATQNPRYDPAAIRQGFDPKLLDSHCPECLVPVWATQTVEAED